MLSELQQELYRLALMNQESAHRLQKSFFDISAKPGISEISQPYFDFVQGYCLAFHVERESPMILHRGGRRIFPVHPGYGLLDELESGKVIHAVSYIPRQEMKANAQLEELSRNFKDALEQTRDYLRDPRVKLEEKERHLLNLEVAMEAVSEPLLKMRKILVRLNDVRRGNSVGNILLVQTGDAELVKAMIDGVCSLRAYG